jgi:DNA polymerase-3 subunit delta
MDSIYLFYGEEKYLIEETIKKIKKSFSQLIDGINYIKIDENNVTSLIDDIKTPSFCFDKKLIIVRNTGILKKQGKKKNSDLVNLSEKIANFLEEEFSYISDGNVIIFIEDEIEKNALYKFIEKNGKVINFEYEKMPNLIKRIKNISNAYSVEISDANAKYLVECCGTSIQDIINELRKVIEYKGKNGVIEKIDIDLLVIKQIDSIIFDLTDNLGKKNIKEALTVLNNLIYQKEPVQKILISLYNHFKKIYFTKIAIQENRNLSEALNLKPNQSFLVNKYKMQSNYFKIDELKMILSELAQLDYSYKIGNIDINIGLETILCNYCS